MLLWTLRAKPETDSHRGWHCVAFCCIAGRRFFITWIILCRAASGGKPSNELRQNKTVVWVIAYGSRMLSSVRVYLWIQSMVSPPGRRYCSTVRYGQPNICVHRVWGSSTLLSSCNVRCRAALIMQQQEVSVSLNVWYAPFGGVAMVTRMGKLHTWTWKWLMYAPALWFGRGTLWSEPAPGVPLGTSFQAGQTTSE